MVVSFPLWFSSHDRTSVCAVLWMPVAYLTHHLLMFAGRLFALRKIRSCPLLPPAPPDLDHRCDIILDRKGVTVMKSLREQREDLDSTARFGLTTLSVITLIGLASLRWFTQVCLFNLISSSPPPLPGRFFHFIVPAVNAFGSSI